jgi:acetyl-CoA C-acetyltransferase
MLVATEVYVYDAVRTPRGLGKAKGALYATKPVTLVVQLLHAIARRHPALDVGAIADVVMGVTAPIGDQGGVLPRTAALLAGWPHTVPGVQLNRYCGSGLEAVNMAAARVGSGWEDLLLAGGVDSMSRIPMLAAGDPLFHDAEVSFALHTISQGVAADMLATRSGITREDVDRYAVESHVRAAKAWTAGAFAKSIVPVVDENDDTVLAHDELVRPDASMEALGALRPSFREIGAQSGFDEVLLQHFPDTERVDHVHTPGNSSGIVDGASLVLVGSREAGERNGLTPRARIRSVSVAGADPVAMFLGPVPACESALRKAGMTIGDVDLLEVNEAFAVVPIQIGRVLGTDLERINPNGGAIAMGHPLGATGGMLLGTALDELERCDANVALVTLCIAAGMGNATILERV